MSALPPESTNVPNQPMAEVFGFRIDDFSAEAVRHRRLKFCPFHNKVARCTKVSAKNPLGVCSVYEGQGNIAITCPVRFRQDYLILEDAAKFFFPASPNVDWTDLREVRLLDATGLSAGNIDIVLVSYDVTTGQLLDFGALEVQAVYISGNIRTAFDHYMEDQPGHKDMNWRGQENYPRPDYLSSSRKRLAPQLIFKGGIMHAWGRKQAVVVDSRFFSTLPAMEITDAATAELAWLIYDLQLDPTLNRYNLVHTDTVYTAFTPALESITRPQAGSFEQFKTLLQRKLDTRLENGDIAPDALTLGDVLAHDSSGGDVIDESEFGEAQANDDSVDER